MARACPIAEFHRSVNMAPAAIRAWARDPRAKIASFAATRARLPALAALKAKSRASWTERDCAFARRVISFNARMSGMVRKHGCTRKAIVALRNWGRAVKGCAIPSR